MKYMMLVYGAEDSWTEDERAKCMADSAKLCHELASHGRYLGASPLHPVATATCVRVRGGRVEHKGRFPLTHRPELDELLLRDLALRGPVSVYGVRKQRRWQVWFRGFLCVGDKQRIRNFIVTRLGTR